MKSEKDDGQLDSFAQALIAFDENLAGESENGDGNRRIVTDPAIGDRLRRAEHCLQLIERVKQQQRETDKPGGDRTADELLPPVELHIPPSIGRFRIVRELGRGGYGVVFLAIDPELNREVALKIPRPEVVLSKDLRQRFLREGRAVASLSHANIVPVYEVGSAGALFYIASAYCEGKTLGGWLKEQHAPVAPDLAANLVHSLAEGVQHAHSRGVVHRDLKPANILLESVVGSPSPVADHNKLRTTDHGLRSKITDFGLAKQVSGEPGASTTEEATRTGAILGTPAYMAPEQAAGAKEVGPAADIYALGVILYELLTGRPPFRMESDVATLRAIELDELISPKRLRKDIPKDLESICLKCLQKKPLARYSSASALAADLRRFENGEPVTARPITAWERALLWLRRRPTMAAAVLLGGLALFALIGVAVYAGVNHRLEWLNQNLKQAVKDEQKARGVAKQERIIAESARDQVRRLLYNHRVLLAHHEWQANNTDEARRLLAECDKSLRGWEWRYLQRLLNANVETMIRAGDRVIGLALSPDGNRVAWRETKGRLKVVDVRSGKTLLETTAKGGGRAIAFSPSGSQLATATFSRVQLWDLTSAKLVQTFGGHQSNVYYLTFSPNGKLIASGGWDKKAIVWDVSTGKTKLVLPGHRKWVERVAVSPSGKYIATHSAGELFLWNGVNGKLLHRIEGVGDSAHSLHFTADGKFVAGACPAQVNYWRVRTGRRIHHFILGKNGYGESVVLYPNRRVLAATFRNTITFYELGKRQELLTLRGSAHDLNNLAVSVDGKYVAAADYDNQIRVFLADRDPNALELGSVLSPHRKTDIAFRPNGKELATFGFSPLYPKTKRWLLIRDAQTGKPLYELKDRPRPIQCLAYSPDGRFLATGCGNHNAAGGVRVWNLKSRKVMLSLDFPNGDCGCIAFDRTSDLLAIGGRGRPVRIWKITTGKEIATLEHETRVRAVDFSPGGRYLATAGPDEFVRLWNVGAGRIVRKLAGHDGGVAAIAFSPDGKQLASAGEDRTIVMWEVDSGKRLRTLRGHTLPVLAVEFHPHEPRLVSASLDKSLRLWDTVTGQVVLTLKGHHRGVRDVAFNPNGTQLVSADDGGIIRIWSAKQIQD